MLNIPKEIIGNTKTCDELLLEFKDINKVNKFTKIPFAIKDKDVYNITAPFIDRGKHYIAGRVEARDSEESEVYFFTEKNGQWIPDECIETLNLQDPFITKINDELILGGVEIFKNNENDKEWNYRTSFYRGDSLETLKPFSKGPDKMKDIRLCQLKNNKILVMTRPQGKVGGRGKIGYIIIDSLEQLNPDNILQAKILENQFIDSQWGGCNELHLLSNGLVGILSHIAKYDSEGNRHYYSSAFCFNPENGEYSNMKIIAVRNNFEDGPSKRPDLKDVIFSGGLVRRNDGKADLYCGVSDTEGHMVTIDDPFVPFENI